ncbi:hypothetical protein AYO47_04790 [Planctomyces sp. SCGC AG-212-M04]|nr:hypothetical protein AYO47_04790 [Planctomyces sp. SCGC AG-212-M04]
MMPGGFFCWGDMSAEFGFNDLHSFKDYVVFVQLCAPTEFPDREGVGPEDKWTLDLAFEGLRLGLRRAIEEKGKRTAFIKGQTLVAEAYAAYREGRDRDGFFKLEELEKLLRKVPSQ